MSPVTLKWKGDELFLGTTKMAYLAFNGPLTKYVIGPSDHVSEPYQSKDDAKQDCMRHVRDLLAKAGA